MNIITIVDTKAAMTPCCSFSGFTFLKKTRNMQFNDTFCLQKMVLQEKRQE